MSVFHHIVLVASDLLTLVVRTSHTSQILAPLGFAPSETVADFYDIVSNPEQSMSAADFDFDVGGDLNVSDADQRVYYELLMGRSFDGIPRQP